MDPTVETITRLFHQVHDALRAEIAGLDSAALNQAPAPGENTIAVLVVHTLGSEAEVLRMVAGQASSRDREAEFRVRGVTAGELRDRLDAADRLLDEIAPAITAARLDARWPRRDEGPRPGRYWLLGNYGHTREHLGQIALTKQILHMDRAG